LKELIIEFFYPDAPSPIQTILSALELHQIHRVDESTRVTD